MIRGLRVLKICGETEAGNEWGMKRVSRSSGIKAAVTVEEVAERMLESGATEWECRGMERAVELFLE